MAGSERMIRLSVGIRTEEGGRVRCLIPNKLDFGALRLYLSYPTIEVLLGEVSAILASSNNSCVFIFIYSSCVLATCHGQASTCVEIKS